MISEGDYILITDSREDRYLQIGEVICAHTGYDGFKDEYKVRFSDGKVIEYDYTLYCGSKVIEFEKDGEDW